MFATVFVSEACMHHILTNKSMQSTSNANDNNFFHTFPENFFIFYFFWAFISISLIFCLF